jgi:hypothetical protein
MYKIHANFHVSPFYFLNATVLSVMMDFFCPFTPTQSLLLYCQLYVRGDNATSIVHLYTNPRQFYTSCSKKEERGWQPCTSVLSCQLIPTPFILHPSITLRNALFSSKTLNQSNKYFHHTVLRTINLYAPRFLYIGKAFRYSPENAFYIFNQQIYFIIRYLLDRVSLI